MKYRIITISGEMCSGKTYLAKALVSLLPGWRYVNTGERFRELCESKGWTIQQVAELDDAVHRELDGQQKIQIQAENDLIVEGRLAGWLAQGLPDVYRVFCTAPFEERVKRYMKREGVTREQALVDIPHRDNADVEKYRRVYGIQDYRQPAYYDLIQDTSTASPQELARQVIQKTENEP